VDAERIPWLTDSHRDALAHLTTITIQRQLHPERPWSYERVSEALDSIADDGEITLRADDHNVWVFICGRVIVHAARDWLEWFTPQWAATESN
jgi:hypothetical protein